MRVSAKCSILEAVLVLLCLCASWRASAESRTLDDAGVAQRLGTGGIKGSSSDHAFGNDVCSRGGRQDAILPEGSGVACAHKAGEFMECITMQYLNQGICEDRFLAHWNCVSEELASSRTPSSGFNRVRHTRHGMFVYSPFDLYFAIALELYGEWGWEELQLMSIFLEEGDVVVEAGAHIGTMTAPLSRFVGASGKVIAFEPQRSLVQLHTANMALNGIHNVRLVNAALGVGREERPARIVKFPADQMRNYGGVQLDKEEGSELQYDEVPVVSVDSLNLERVALMKLDCEGSEDMVILGAQETIEANLPVIYLEANLPLAEEEGIGFVSAFCGRGVIYLHHLKYQCWYHESPLYPSPNCFNETKNYFRTAGGGPVVSKMLLCIPPRITRTAEWLDGGMGAVSDLPLWKCKGDRR